MSNPDQYRSKLLVQLKNLVLKNPNNISGDTVKEW